MYQSDIRHTNTDLAQKLQKLYKLNRNKALDLSFRPPYLSLLEAFDNPHLTLPPVIHVAGTNGKGSVIAFLRSILEEAGLRVHTYTSPHLQSFNERIVLAGNMIDDTTLENLIDEALKKNEEQDLTFFEITTAIAFAAFSRTPGDIVLLETGLGGRLDCTNIIQNPLITVINIIAYDHMEYLGSSLREIALEKAGIMKRNAPCVIGRQSEHSKKDGIIEVFKTHAHEIGTTLYIADQDWEVIPKTDGFQFSSQPSGTIDYPLPNLYGLHQIANAGTAIATIKILQKMEIFTLSEEHIQKGISNAFWPARLQKLKLPGLDEWDIRLDGGHNQSASEALAEQIKAWKQEENKPVDLIIGMMAHKDPKAFLGPLLPYINSLHVVPIPNETQALKPEELLQHIRIPDTIQVYTHNDISNALHHFKEKRDIPGRILITGSLYLAGHVLQLMRNQDHNIRALFKNSKP